MTGTGCSSSRTRAAATASARLRPVRHALQPGELRPVNDDEPMRGTPVYAIGAPDGRWLLTLYVKPDGEGFVHALDLRRAKALLHRPA